MAETVSVNEAFVDVRQEGGRWRGYITPAWFRYLVVSTPQGTGTGTGVLHGNGAGSPTWGPVVLTTDVSGKLPVANGGIGDVTGNSGGVLTFTGSSTVVSSPTLQANRLVTGGGAAGAPSTSIPIGSAGLVLHGTGALPSWGPVSLTADVSGILQVFNGGTGTTTSTGTGDVVLNNNPTLFGGTFSSPNLVTMNIFDRINYAFPNPTQEHILCNNTNLISVTAVATTCVALDQALFFVAYDKTSGGMSVGVMDPISGLVVIIFGGIAGIAFTRLAGTGLQAAVTAGANPRSLSFFCVQIGV
jgi:hypothetical protein